MKIKNTTTGEIVDLCEGWLGEVGCGEYIVVKPVACLNKEYRYDSWEKFMSEWEEYKGEESSGHWWIDGDGGLCWCDNESGVENQQEIGNYFKTEELANDALKGLKALNRLRDAGLEFEGWRFKANTAIGSMITITALVDDLKSNEEDLNLLFGDKE